MKRFLPNSLRCYSRLPRSSSWSSTVTESGKPLLREKSSSSCHCYQLERKLLLLENKVGQMCKVVSHLQSESSSSQSDQSGHGNANGTSVVDAPTLARMFFESDLDELKHRVCRLESNPLEDVDEIIMKQEEIIQTLKHNNALLEKKLDHLLTSSQHYSVIKSSAGIPPKPLRSPSSVSKTAATTSHRGAATKRTRSRCFRTSDVVGCLIVLIFLISLLIGISL